MPRAQKSKLRTHKKHNRSRGDSESHKSVQAAAVAEEPRSCSSLEANPQSTSAPGTSSASQGFSRASCTTITSSGAVHTKSDKGGKSQDQPPSSSSEVSSENSCSDVNAMKVDLLEQFLLCKYKMEEPILKEDMLKLIGEINQEQFADILKKASERIEVVFAVDLKEVNSNHSYDLVSKLKLPNNGRMSAGMGLPKTGVLMNILGLIFMKGNCATEEDIWKFLNMLQIYDGREHVIYGEPRKLITEDFVQLQYLEYRQVPGSDPARFEFLWGPKAHAETSKMKVLEFLAKAGDKDPSAFPFWYEEALQDEERAQAMGAASSGMSAPAKHDSVGPAACTPTDG